MEVIFLVILVALLGVVSTILYLNLKFKPKDENKDAEEIANLKSEISNLKDTLNTTINNSLGSMSTSFNAVYLYTVFSFINTRIVRSSDCNMIGFYT